MTAGCSGGDGGDGGDTTTGGDGGDGGDTTTTSGDGGDGGDTTSTSGDGGTTTPSIDGPIKVGGLFPLPGQFPGGTGMENGSKVIIDEVNSNGGLLGAEMELITKDTKLDPSTGRSAYRELILNEEVDYTTGTFSSEVGTAILDELPNFSTIHSAGGTSHMNPPELVRNEYDKYKYWFRPIGNGHHWGQGLADMAAERWEQWGITDLGVAAEDINGFIPIIEKALEEMPDFVNVKFDKRFSSDTSDFSPILDQGESADIDNLFSFTAQGGSALVTQWAQRQPSFSMGGCEVFSSNPARWENTDGRVENIWTYIPGSMVGVEVNERTEEFIQQYRDMFNGPPPHSQAYTQHAAVQSYVDAVRKAGSLEPDDIIAEWEKMSITAVHGTLDFYGQDGAYPHDPKYGLDFMVPPTMQWQENDSGGGPVGLWPDKAKKGDFQMPDWI
jgi:branched-chain amino acid transport system substrate-binding protein